MLSQVIWGSGVALEILLLVRGFRGKLASRYPVFYCYILFVFLQDIVRTVTYQLYRQIYRDLYWATEFLAVMFGCAVVFEIYRVGLASYPGTARMARRLLVFVFAAASLKALAGTWNDPRWWAEAATTDIEGTLRTVQALFIVALVALFLIYSIPFGKNLRGILLGYGFFVSWSVVCLPIVSSAGSGLREFLSDSYPVSFFLALGFWLAHLWSYAAAPEPKAAVRLEQEYQTIAAATRRRLQDARGYLARVVRP
jgi:hypothetical protein